MAEFAEKYINPFTDYGFKKLFGEEPNKDLLLEDSLKYYRDLKNSLDTAKEEGKIEVAKNAIAEGLPTDVIMKITGLTIQQIDKIKNK